MKNTGNKNVNDGSAGVICPQASPGWGKYADEFFTGYLKGERNFSLSAAEAAANASAGSTPPPPADPRTSEDCLFLDIVVPEKVFHGSNGTSGAPVMVWFYGGYTFGDKAGSGNPAGLIKASQDTGNPGVLYLSFNYRVGLAALG